MIPITKPSLGQEEADAAAAAVVEIARRHGLKVIEDAAPSLGATVGEGRVGSLSDFTCFSFHPHKSITTGEGGIITTDDDEAAARLRVIRSHGMADREIATRRGVMAIHREPLYQRLSPSVSLPVTEAASARTLLLPLFAGMTESEQDFVVASLREALD